MKNAMEIKKEAKEQIIKLLDMCGCYNFKEEHIDTWLNVWEEACSPQIEKIAEKSPYYDGKCKIVFPSEYPREINANGINSFCEWLKDFPSRNLEPAKIDGMTYREARQLRDFYCRLSDMEFGNVNVDLLPEDIKQGVSILLNVQKKDDYWSQVTRCDSIFRSFRHSCSIEMIDGEAYNRGEFDKSGAKAALTLSVILSESYARTQFLNERLVENLSCYFNKCKFAVGQKLSRAVNAIASKYNINKDPDWNKEFAKYADSINPLTVTKWTVISWHPVDYLTFCFGNSWSTCSNIDKRNVRKVKIGSSVSSITSYVHEDYVFRGEHSAAALSYMFDKTSFIYYTVNHKYEGNHYEEQDKESRIVFSLNEDMDTLLQSRLYPQCHDDSADDSNYRIPREIVQKVISDALENPNLWKMKKGSAMCRRYANSIGVHYPDYIDSRNKNCNISWTGDEPKVITVGHNAICPNCGCIHEHTSSLNCRDCDPDYDPF